MAKFIKYTGASHVRAILKHEWQAVGVRDQPALIWNQANGWTVPLSTVTDNAWPYIDADAELIVVDIDLPDRPDRPANEPPSEVVESQVSGDQATGAVAEEVVQTPDGEARKVK